MMPRLQGTLQIYYGQFSVSHAQFTLTKHVYLNQVFKKLGKADTENWNPVFSHKIQMKFNPVSNFFFLRLQMKPVTTRMHL